MLYTFKRMGGNKMKKFSLILVVMLIILCLTVFAACPEKESEVPEEKEKITTLVGNWKEIITKGKDLDYYEIEITESTIKVFYNDVRRGERTCTWTGSYKDPSEPCEKYTFVSIEDGDNSSKRTFTYSDGVLATDFIRGIELICGEGDTLRAQKVTETNQ